MNKVTSRNQHVAPSARGGWSVRKAGAARATKTFKTQGAAIVAAKKMAETDGAIVYVHGIDGLIQERLA